MRIRQQSSFSFVRTEGAILPADLLSRIHEGDQDLGGLRAEDYHLIAGERLNEAITRSWNRMLGAWSAFVTAYAALPPGDPALGLTREKLLLPLFDELHYGRLPTTKAMEVNGKTYPVSHEWQNVPIHLVGYGVNLDSRMAGVAGAARYSPHGMMQELLNRSDDHLWGFVSNGAILRILRDNVSLTRQAFVEFNLESIFEGEAYADFALLWLLCHQSRVEADRPEEFWLERWSQTARTEGARALDRLRDGVEAAITSLGRGFIAHPSNQVLQDRLRKGDLTKQDYYRQLLRLVYRLIFLFTAEDRDLLFVPDTPREIRDRYTRFYSTARLRSLAGRRRGTAHPDLYRSLILIMGKFGESDGCPELGLPALGSFLWSGEAMPDLESSQLSNTDLLSAVRDLAFSEESGVRRPIDYKNLGAEELGSIYESLLELDPDINLEGKTFTLRIVGGSERKTTGSYYTPSSLIQQLLDTALDPVIEAALKKENPQEALLDLKVCDPACGSGHFLVAAAHRIARRVASLRTGDEEPSPDAQRHALRDVIRSCIYGVDINPLAVELCKVNLWLETIDPGLPLSFLDHRILCGNSLLGTTPRLMAGGIPSEAFNPIEGDDRSFASALKRQNTQERPREDLQALGIESAQSSMFDRIFTDANSSYRAASLDASKIDVIEEDTLEGVAAKKQAYQKLLDSKEYIHCKLVADAWCAAFVWHKTEEAPPAPTDHVFRRLSTGSVDLPPETLNEIQLLAELHKLLHWHLAFPSVFTAPEDLGNSEIEETGWSGGFDVVLGNPPWERVKLQEKEWFAGRNDAIANAPNKAQRTLLINRLKEEEADLYSSFVEARRRAEAESHFARNSGRFPFCGRGDINTYAIFAETMRSLISSIGRVGCILPTGIATGDTTKHFFQDLVERSWIASLYDFENSRGLFPIERNLRFSLMSLRGPATPTHVPDYAFFLTAVEDLGNPDRHIPLSAEEIHLLNPNTRTCPIFRSRKDAELTKAIYRRVPVLIKEVPPEENPWGIKFSTMFHMSNDSHLFHKLEDLISSQLVMEGNEFRSNSDRFVPIYEAKLVHQFNHRAATFDGIPESDRFKIHAGTREVGIPYLTDPSFRVIPRYWISSDEVSRFSEEVKGWRIGFRNAISAVADSRSLVACLVPPSGVGNSLPLIIGDLTALRGALLLALLNSFVLDYVLRLKAGGGNLNFFIAKQLPILNPEACEQPSTWDASISIQEWFLCRVAELSYTSWDLQPYFVETPSIPGPFVWNEARRFLLRCELDAAVFHLYGLSKDSIALILDSFPIVRGWDEEQHGEYRTKRVIGEIYDEMQDAITTGEPYQTQLDPPPADPKCCHPDSGQ